MGMQIADRMRSMNPSAIREILKASADISFSAGNPDPETFPAEELGELAAGIFEREHKTALQYGITEGYGPLREMTKKRIKMKYNIGTDADELIIVSGGEQGIDLAAKCLTNEGDAVICENPSFVGALNDFRSYGLRLVGIPVGGSGMELDSLERALKTEKRAKIIYTIPTFQNPMGVTMPLERRKKLYELAVKYDVMIVEDSPYFELRYSGDRVPAIKSLDTTGHVLFIGSYSKVIAPGLRVGFVSGPGELIRKMTVAKQGQDVHTNLLSMMLVAGFLDKYDLDAQIDRCRALYRAKRDRMIAGLERDASRHAEFTRPEGGLFIWGMLPAGYSGRELCAYTGKRGLAIVPGIAFDTENEPENPGFRLNFSMPSLEHIDRGTAILGESIREYLRLA